MVAPCGVAIGNCNAMLMVKIGRVLQCYCASTPYHATMQGLPMLQWKLMVSGAAMLAKFSCNVAAVNGFAGY